MDYEVLKFWVDVVFKIGTIAGLIWLAVTTRVKVNKDAIEGVVRTVGDHGTRLTRIEERGNHAPTHNDLGNVYSAIKALDAKTGDMGKDISEIQGYLKAVSKSLDLLNEYHMGNGK